MSDCINYTFILYVCAYSIMCPQRKVCVYCITLLFAHRLYNKMTMEVILSTAFGRAVDVQGGKGGKLYKAALEAFASLTPGQDNEMKLTRILQFLICKSTCGTTLHASNL